MQEWQERIEAKVDQNEKRIAEVEKQQTEPIQITVERRYPDKELLQEISRKQDEHARLLLAHSKGISTLQTDMEGIKADVKAIRESQADFRDSMVTKRDFVAFEARMTNLVRQLLDDKKTGE
jgi:hypothetical protein